MTPAKFDVFVCYHPADEAAAVELANSLKEMGVHPWIGAWNHHPDEPLPDAIQRGLAESDACVVLIGAAGLDFVEQSEIGTALQRRQSGCEVDTPYRVIGALLPQVTRGSLAAPPFLTGMKWIKFEQSLGEPESVIGLVQAIRGAATAFQIDPDSESNYPANGDSRDKPFDVFISHSKLNKLDADAICNKLESAGIRCWIAPRNIVPGTEWGAGIIDGIDKSRAMVIVFSKHADESPQVRREVERAINRELIVIPFRVENTMPTRSMEYCLSNTHWLDAFTPPLERHIEQLITAIQQLVCGRDKSPGPAASAPSQMHAATANTVSGPSAHAGLGDGSTQRPSGADLSGSQNRAPSSDARDDIPRHVLPGLTESVTESASRPGLALRPFPVEPSRVSASPELQEGIRSARGGNDAIDKAEWVEEQGGDIWLRDEEDSGNTKIGSKPSYPPPALNTPNAVRTHSAPDKANPPVQQSRNVRSTGQSGTTSSVLPRKSSPPPSRSTATAVRPKASPRIETHAGTKTEGIQTTFWRSEPWASLEQWGILPEGTAVLVLLLGDAMFASHEWMMSTTICIAGAIIAPILAGLRISRGWPYPSGTSAFFAGGLCTFLAMFVLSGVLFFLGIVFGISTGGSSNAFANAFVIWVATALVSSPITCSLVGIARWFIWKATREAPPGFISDWKVLATIFQDKLRYQN